MHVNKTKGERCYNIVDLRPETYRVTFSLPGFNTGIREGIVLTPGLVVRFMITVTFPLVVSLSNHERHVRPFDRPVLSDAHPSTSSG